jgi:hypothetical protein
MVKFTFTVQQICMFTLLHPRSKHVSSALDILLVASSGEEEIASASTILLNLFFFGRQSHQRRSCSEVPHRCGPFVCCILIHYSLADTFQPYTKCYLLLSLQPASPEDRPAPFVIHFRAFFFRYTIQLKSRRRDTALVLVRDKRTLRMWRILRKPCKSSVNAQ